MYVETGLSVVMWHHLSAVGEILIKCY